VDGNLYTWGKQYSGNFTGDTILVTGIEHNVSFVSGCANHFAIILGGLNINSFASMFNNSKFSDIKFIIDGKELFAHSLVLNLRCPKLLELPKIEDTILIEFIPYEHFVMILNYIYCDYIANVKPRAAFALMDFAKKLELNRLASICDSIYNRYKLLLVLPSTLSNELEDAFTNKKYCDLEFILPQGKIKAHKLILYSRNQYFKMMFDTGMNEDTKGEVAIPEDSYDNFYVLIDYIYNFKTEITGQNVIELYMISHKYRVTDLTFICENIIVQNVDLDIIEIVAQLAETYKSNLLMKTILNYIEKNKSLILEDVIENINSNMSPETKEKNRKSILFYYNL